MWWLIIMLYIAVIIPIKIILVKSSTKLLAENWGDFWRFGDAPSVENKTRPKQYKLSGLVIWLGVWVLQGPLLHSV